MQMYYSDCSYNRPSDRVRKKKSEIMQHFQGRLCDKLCIFSGLINIVLPGFNGEKSL